ncbi:GDSL-type esterase/lipase family protein [Aeoliella sp. ICT_H6.2]|uniref:GDSL-type esterase/lipase family protein n=1 Tax=Aeoliella straminimaris TaxID=2954799 RepID=A0A9X2FAT0_9BACT|nr:GDSL-type esterase/lipase family protein [Aeoliella straminimaris]MCO6045099.1 GDSL-type esterase/lipase family protein [Aeoliella straminimaris]
MRLGIFSFLLVLLAGPALGQTEFTGRWAADMQKFAKADAEHPSEPGGVVFVGSSSIRLWDLEKSFPKLDPPALNRGFGGSQLADSIRYAELLVTSHKPRIVVIYAGDNDIAAGKTAERVESDFVKLAEKIQTELPETKIAFIAVKPSTRRWNLADTIQDANARVAKRCADNDQWTFIDVWKPMLGEDGKPREELLRDDGLHMTDKGYELWSSLVRPLLKDEDQK